MDINWRILTNECEYEFFQRRVIDSKVRVELLAGAQLHHLPDRITILRAFSERSIQTGNSENIATHINELKEARVELEQLKDHLATELAELLGDNGSDAISSHAESHAKDMIDRLIQDIDIETDRDDIVKSAEKNGEYVVMILNDGTTLATVSDDSQSEFMADVVNYLIANYDLISKIESVPYIHDEEKAVINDRPTSPMMNKR